MTPGLDSNEINGLVAVIGNIEDCPSNINLRKAQSSNRMCDISEEEKDENYHV